MSSSPSFRVLVSSLLAMGLLAISPALLAQDTRTVNEPTFPVTCTTLAATQSITSAGEPTSETAFDTSRIQTALNGAGAACSGKTVELTTGGTNGVYNAFLIQPIYIPTGVTLVVDAGVTVFASRNPADYQISGTSYETCGTVGTKGNGCYPLLTAGTSQAGGTTSGSGIMGYGVINARGGDALLNASGTPLTNLYPTQCTTFSWWCLANVANTGSNAQNNPILLYLSKASNFTLYKISFWNSPMFHVKYQSASGFTVWGIKIVTPYSSRNTDGIDPDDNVTNMTVENSYISDGDDNIALGATAGNPVSNVTINGDYTYSGHGISIGSYTAGGVSNVLVENVNQSGNQNDTNAAGLKIKTAQDRGGVISNIQYNGICMQNERYPLQFNPFYNSNTGTSYPTFTNIGLHNITIAALGVSEDQFDGFNATYPLNITFDNLYASNSNTSPATEYANITLGPGPIRPVALQTMTGTDVNYTGVVTKPNEARWACSATNFPFLAGELFLSTSTLTNQKTLSLSNPATFTLNAMLQITDASSPLPTAKVQFYEGTTLVGSGTIGAYGAGNGTVATATLSGITSGVHVYTAEYPGDTNFAAETFGSVTVNVGVIGTTTTMIASPTSTTYGSSVLLTATVVQATGTVIPNGTVTFYSNGVSIGTGTLNGSGVATLTTTTLAVGTDQVYASYGGSTNFGASSSSATPTPVTIGYGATTTTISANPTSAFYGSTITLTATVVSQTTGTPTDTVTFYDGATVLGTQTLTGNTAVLTTTALTAKSHTITAVYGGDVNFNGSTSATGASVTIFTTGTTTAVGFTASSVPYGTNVTMLASVTSAIGGTATTATGNIVFTDGGTTIATVAVSNGTASYATSTLTVGVHNIVATYSGDTDYTGSASSVSPLTVTQAGSTTTLGATSTSITYGTSDTFTATVSPGVAGTPTGTVTFKDGAATIGSGTLSSGQASYTAPALVAGSHSITAVYSGDLNFTGSTSSPLTVTVGTAASTTTVSVPAPITYGGSALLSATVSSTVTGVALTGTVTFKDGTTTLGSGTVSGGTASYSANGLVGGTHSITAVYSGDTNYATSTSTAQTLTVNKAGTTATVSANPTTVTYGGSTTLTANVTTVSGGVAPTGSVSFYNGTTLVGSTTLSAGVASLPTNALPTGSDSITAVYAGDGNYNTATTATAVTVVVNQATGTAALTANPTTLTYGASTLLTVTVNAAATGTVTFKDGTALLANVNVASGKATYTAGSLGGGTHNLSCVYSGDTNFTSATCAVVVVTVSTAATTTALVANPTTLTYGASTLLTATVSSTTVTGSVTFKDGTTTLGSGTVANGVATYTAAGLVGGGHSITAVYSGDTNYAGSTSSAVTVTVSVASTTTGLAANPNPITYGGATLLTATVSSTTATGSVTFKDGTTTLGTGTVSAGVATYNATALVGGTHSITAVYSGDGNYAGSTSAVVVVTVNTAAITAGLNASPSTTTYGTSVLMTVTLSNTSATGTVTFKDGTTVLGSAVTVVSGVATMSSATFTVGAHNLSCAYSGDTNFSSATCAVTVLTINLGPTTSTVSANPASLTYGASTLLTATVSPAAGTGNFTFKDGSTTLGTGTIAGGVATFTAIGLTAGTHSITAVYSGDGNYATSTSAATSVVVNQVTTTTVLTATPSTLNYGATTTLNATVSSTSATGTMTFKDGTATLGTAVTVVNGVASLPVSTLTVGTHSITAMYSGDTNFTASTSAVVSVVVNLAPTTSSITATPASAAYGSATVITVTVAPSAATGTVTFKDGGATIGTAALSGGVATLSPVLAAGTHTLSATYPGDVNYAASATTTSATVVISMANAVVTAGASPSTVAFGLATTMSATVTPAGATGSVSFKDTTMGITLGSATVTSGVATMSGVVLSPAGAHSITATYSGDGNVNGATSAATTVTVTPGATVTTLANSPASPVVYGTNLALSTTNTVLLGVPPTGTVKYYDGTTLLGSVAVTLNGSNVPVSSFSLATLMPGVHSLTAVYSGDANYASSTSAVDSVTVTQSNSTTTMVATPPQVTPTQSFTLTATVGDPTGSAVPTGSVTFYNSSNVSLGTVALVNGVATSAAQSLSSLGSFTYYAVYSGDADFTTSSSQTSPTVVVVKQLPSATSLVATPTSGTFGNTTYSVTATVSSTSGGTPTGSVVFKDGTTTLGTVTLTSSDVVSLSGLTLLGGTHNIVATYSGDATYVLSVSPTVVITVNTASTTTGLVVSPATSSVGTSVTFTATVSESTSTAATGTVNFMNGSVLLGSGTVSGGTASFTTSSLAIGTYTVTAVYSGDTNFAGSTSAVVPVTVTQIAQTITLSSLPANVTYGVAPLTVTATATSGLTVSLGVTGPATLVGSTLTITGAGSVTVTATQAGNATYAAATPVVVTIVVAKAPLTVVVNNQLMQAGGTVPTLTGTLTGVVNNDNITVTYATTGTSSSPAGTYPITATLVDPGGRLVNYTVTNTPGVLTITGIAQTITFGALPNVTYGVLPITLTATASSNLAVTYTSTGPATLSGSTLSVTGVGQVCVTASQAGNGTYAVATPVKQCFTVSAAALSEVVNNQSMNVGATVPTLTGTLTGVVNGDNITASYATTGTSSSPAGTYPITATLVDPNGRLANYTVTNTPGVLTISLGTQTITFPALTTPVVYGVAPMTLKATASSNLAVTYSVTGPATIVGSTLTITGAGSVTVTASQAGNTTYAAATPVAQTVVVNQAPLTVTVASASRAYGLANPTLSGTVTGVVNGDNITATYATTATAASAPGTYPITATLVDPGSRLSNYSVTNTAGTLTVTAGTTSVTLTLSAAQILAGSPVTMTAIVASPSGAPASGSVAFTNGSASLGTATVTNGTAGLNLTSLPAGVYSVVATFAATTDYAAGASAAQTLTVVNPVSLTLSPTSLSLAASGSGTSTLTVAPQGGFTGTVTLTCSSPVSYVTCTVSGSPMTISGTTAGTSTVTIGVAATAEMKLPQIGPRRDTTFYALLLPLGGLLMLPLMKRRKLMRLLMIVLMVVGTSAVFTGCGGGNTSTGVNLPPPGPQTITITASANGVQILTTLTVNVTN